ncbi:MAG: SHOCT domain-containing protein [Spirulinaceae cyanobacterium]
MWYCIQDQEDFERRFNQKEPVQYSQSPPRETNQVKAIADSLRQLDQLRQEGLMSEYEFEQKRRQLLNRIA